MTTRALDLTAVAIGGYVVVLAAVALMRFIGLVTADQWLFPLVAMMGIHFVAGCLLASKLGKLDRETIGNELRIKVLLTLAVMAGFTVQRMGDPMPEGTSPPWTAWGHVTIGAAIGFEFLRFVRILRAFGLRLGPLELIAVWFEKTFIEAYRETQLSDAKAEGRFQSQLETARQYVESGEIKPPTAVMDVIDQEYADSGVLDTKRQSERRDDIHK